MYTQVYASFQKGTTRSRWLAAQRAPPRRARRQLSSFGSVMAGASVGAPVDLGVDASLSLGSLPSNLRSILIGIAKPADLQRPAGLCALVDALALCRGRVATGDSAQIPLFRLRFAAQARRDLLDALDKALPEAPSGGWSVSNTGAAFFAALSSSAGLLSLRQDAFLLGVDLALPSFYSLSLADCETEGDGLWAAAFIRLGAPSLYDARVSQTEGSPTVLSQLDHQSSVVAASALAELEAVLQTLGLTVPSAGHGQSGPYHDIALRKVAVRHLISGFRRISDLFLFQAGINGFTAAVDTMLECARDEAGATRASCATLVARQPALHRILGGDAGDTALVANLYSAAANFRSGGAKGAPLPAVVWSPTSIAALDKVAATILHLIEKFAPGRECAAAVISMLEEMTASKRSDVEALTDNDVIAMYDLRSVLKDTPESDLVSAVLGSGLASVFRAIVTGPSKAQLATGDAIMLAIASTVQMLPRALGNLLVRERVVMRSDPENTLVDFDLSKWLYSGLAPTDLAGWMPIILAARPKLVLEGDTFKQCFASQPAALALVQVLQQIYVPIFRYIGVWHGFEELLQHISTATSVQDISTPALASVLDIFIGGIGDAREDAGLCNKNYSPSARVSFSFMGTRAQRAIERVQEIQSLVLNLSAANITSLVMPAAGPSGSHTALKTHAAATPRRDDAERGGQRRQERSSPPPDEEQSTRQPPRKRQRGKRAASLPPERSSQRQQRKEQHAEERPTADADHRSERPVRARLGERPAAAQPPSRSTPGQPPRRQLPDAASASGGGSAARSHVAAELPGHYPVSPNIFQDFGDGAIRMGSDVWKVDTLVAAGYKLDATGIPCPTLLTIPSAKMKAAHGGDAELARQANCPCPSKEGHTRPDDTFHAVQGNIRELATYRAKWPLQAGFGRPRN